MMDISTSLWQVLTIVGIVTFLSSSGAPREERGYNRVFKNDGTGNFTDVRVIKDREFGQLLVGAILS